MKKILNTILFLCFIGITTKTNAQSADLARIEYTNFPQSNSDNSFSRFRSSLKFPVKLNDSGAYLIPGIQYENINFQYKDAAPFPTENLEHLQSYTFSLGYTFKMSEEWRFGIQGEVNATSNFETEKLQSEDVEYTGTIFFIKSKKDQRFIQPWRLILGLRYSTSTSINFPLPIINYYKRVHPKWSYTLGVPKTNLRYYLGEKSALQAFVTVDGFYANIQEKFNPNAVTSLDKKLAQNISITTVLSGIGYELKFSEYFSFYIYGGHSLINDIRLRDENQDRVYTINDTNSLYGRTGLKFSIL
ncbi:DUF6268 family outer membrane beta-barrel protein [Gillisia hiemivivida]|uniref:DUF6268 domain-containing protein n=1 Tax=Gillisia hiemivivida TaxID=291190 RepID=A0A5C6ZUH6_9FLAO|nr:DUF6268 family outer membrane beta-barrel protein [Gillisia hiemivivida]TXD92492.1 hypothetical protein ES724_13460 [Gillisia hiemivivida]